MQRARQGSFDSELAVSCHVQAEMEVNCLFGITVSFRKRLDQSKSPRVRLQRLEKYLDQKVTIVRITVSFVSNGRYC